MPSYEVVSGRGQMLMTALVMMPQFPSDPNISEIMNHLSALYCVKTSLVEMIVCLKPEVKMLLPSGTSLSFGRFWKRNVHA